MTITIVLAAAGTLLGALSTIWVERMRRRHTQQMMAAERELKLAAHSIVLKPDEVIPPLGGPPVQRGNPAIRLRIGPVSFVLRTGRGRRPTGPTWGADGLAGIASFLLPAADRARYSEEYRSELWDLAQAGAGRIRQLQYALRQLRNALPTSSALRAPRRRSSAP